LCECVYNCTQTMSETLSVRIDAATKRRLDALARRSKRSKSFLAAEAITAYVEAEEWQTGEILAGIADADAGRVVSHDRVVKWLRSWGKPSEGKAP
jgi:RHH-type transcriptional regulator, rel operon repressor / antitoxin RelB